jgi:hypothetical protein
MPKTNFLEDLVLNHFLRNQATTGPYTAYVALATSATVPTETGANFTEVTGGAYARQTAGFGVPTTVTGGPNYVQNTSAISFPQATAAWGTVRYVGIFTAVSGGSMLYFQQLAADKVVGIDDIFEFLAGSLQTRED